VVTRGARALLGALALLCAAAPAARAASQAVSVQFAAFAPATVDALPGDAVTWTNESRRTHTVTSPGFDSGDLLPGASFTQAFEQTGTVAYHCVIHPGMAGEVDVRHVTLDPLPTAVLAPGTKVELSGRTDDPAQPVRIERGATKVASATPSPSGDWAVTIRARERGDLRAVTPAGASQVRRLFVSRQEVHLRATRTGVAIRVTPSDPYGRILLQVRRRERFGWWPLARTRLDYLSEARVRIRRGGRVRALLVDRDGWTPLAISPEVRFSPLPSRSRAE
jgi:plastocyanin